VPILLGVLFLYDSPFDRRGDCEKYNPFYIARQYGDFVGSNDEHHPLSLKPCQLNLRYIPAFEVWIPDPFKFNPYDCQQGGHCDADDEDDTVGEHKCSIYSCLCLERLSLLDVPLSGIMRGTGHRYLPVVLDGQNGLVVQPLNFKHGSVPTGPH
jgi:hypothetical protein